MTAAIFFALMGFAFVATVTPGPNNLMLMASGANFGFRRTVPHMLGIPLGMSVLLLGVGLGLNSLFGVVPGLRFVLMIGCAAYLVWLAWKIARAGAPEGRDAGVRPLTILQAAAFQWINPKTWAMGLSAIALYAPDQSLGSILTVAAAFALVCLPSVSLWAWLGTMLRRWLAAPNRRRVFNLVMAILLLATLYPVFRIG